MNPIELQQSMDRIAPCYDRHAALEQEVCRRLLERADHHRRTPQTALDLGCGTGAGCAELKKLFKKAQVLGLDLSPGMLGGLKNRSRMTRPLRALCGDFHALPLNDLSVDLVVSSLALNWSPDPAAVFAEVRRVLKPGGLFLFATLGLGSLAELNNDFQSGPSIQPPELPDLLEIGNTLFAAGFREPVMDRERITLEYPDIEALVEELDATGTSLLIEGWSKPDERRKCLKQAFLGQPGTGKYPLGFEVIYGAAFAPPEQEAAVSDRRDTLNISLGSLPKTRAISYD